MRSAFVLVMAHAALLPISAEGQRVHATWPEPAVMLVSSSSAAPLTTEVATRLPQEAKCTIGDISGCSGPVRTGLLFGGIGGALIGGIIGYATFDENAEATCSLIGGCREPLGKGERTVSGAVLGGLLGASFGVIVGSIVDSRSEVEVAPNGSGGLRLGLSFAM